MYRVLLDNVTANREKFIEIHTNPYYYGSSGVANVCGLNKFCLPLEEWVYRGKLRVREDISRKISVRRGNVMQPVLDEIFTEMTGKAVVPFDQVIQHSEYDWAIASPDSRLVDENALLEDKCVSYRSKYLWEDGGAPDYYMIQLQWQMGISGIPFGYFCALVGEDDVYTPSFAFSKDIFDQVMEQVIKFRELVEKNIPPNAGPGDSKSIKAIYEQREAEAEIASDYWVNEYFKAKALLDEAKAPLNALQVRVDTAKNNIMMAMGGATRGKCGSYRFKVSHSEYVMPERKCERTNFKAWCADGEE